MTNKFSNKEIARYSRQIILNDVGMKGQRSLKNGSVLIVGAGGLGEWKNISDIVDNNIVYFRLSCVK